MSTPFIPALRSLLETDLYKFTMWQTMLHRNPATHAEYRFVCRNATAFPLAQLLPEVNEHLDALCAMRFEADELDYLRGLRFMKSDFIDFLSVFRFQRRFIRAWAEGETLHIVAEGPQVHVMGFEIYVLAIVNELYFRRLTAETVGPVRLAHEEGRRRLEKKIATLQAYLAAHPGARLSITDFGTRRRFSGVWQEEVVARMAQALPGVFRGTSNVYLAKKYGLVAIGTMAHEYLQTYQALGVRLRDSQKAALEDWVQEYRGDLGIALTDVIGMDAFLADFDLYFAKLFDGLRHDSGDPVAWGEKAIAHYQKLRIDPMTKQLVFSDGLTVERAIELYEHFEGRINTGFGIGTNLTNDLGMKALNIVMKLVRANGQPVAKLSDSPGKTLCEDETFIAYLRQVFNHPEVR